MFPRFLLAAGLLAVPGLSRAATQTWNPGGAGGGTGSWSGSNWNAATAWVAGNSALFGGKSGTVTVGTETVKAISFTLGGYTLSGGTITLAPPNASTGFLVTTNVGTGTDTISATLAGTAGSRFTKTGAGTLTVGSITGGTAAGPTVAVVTGGVFSSTNGYFNSILAVPFGDALGTQPGSAATQITLDAGTLKITGTNSAALGTNRGVQVNAAGGAIIDGGGNTYASQVIDSAGSGSSFYFSNPAGKTSTFLSTAVIGGSGSLTCEGVGTVSLAAANTYTGGTVVNKGTLQLARTAGYGGSTVASGSLGSNTLTIAAGATLSLQGAVLAFDLSHSADRLAFGPGTAAVGGVNNVRLATGSSTGFMPGTYALVTASVGSLTGTFEIDGGSTLSIPGTSMIKLVGNTFYRFTLVNASTSEQVAITVAPANVVNVMALGSSITEGRSAQGATYAGGGYRSELYQLLVNDGRFTPNFVGSNTVLDNSNTAGYNVLTGANQLHHEGHGGYTTSNVLTNLNANAGTGGNDGGFWLAPGNGVNPDYVALSIGGNDYGGNPTDFLGPVYRTDAIVTAIAALRPNATVILANLFYRTETATANGTTYVVGDLQNTYYNPSVPAIVYNHVLAGQHVSFADEYDAVTPGNDMSLISDGIHPYAPGYDEMAAEWYDAIGFGSAFWTGGLDNQWSTATAQGDTNFAQNYQRTVPRTGALDARTDVYFNSNSSALATTLGQDTEVRGVNFAGGAKGPVTVGGNNTLTLDAGGITVQSGTGTHTISANVALGSDQTWGNVSTNAVTVSGAISGPHALTITGSYTIQAPVSATSDATVSQTFTGTGSTVLSGPNTYSGGTTVASGTLVVGNISGSGTGSGGVSIAGGATLTNDGMVSGSVSLWGTANGNGSFGGTVEVGGGGAFGVAGTVAGPLTIDAGGLVMLSGGTLRANGGVVNNGTVRLEHGANLLVGGGSTFTNNGTLDIITGGFSAPAGFTNNGVVIDSSVVKVKSASLSGGTFTVTVDSYTGHTYQLQSSGALTDGTFANLGRSQNGTTGTVLTFTDNNPLPSQGFYRVQVDP